MTGHVAFETNKKVRLIVLFGGRSAEREVSALSAASVVGTLSDEKYELIPIRIEEGGVWHFDNSLSSSSARDALDAGEVEIVPLLRSGEESGANDTVVFPILHGPLGEDGSMQGFLDTIDVAYVGPGVLASALCMDKIKCKEILRSHGVPVAEYVTMREGADFAVTRNRVREELSYPVFVKPANMGSSVGVSRVDSEDDLQPAIEAALCFDEWVLIEERVVGREIEFGVLEGDELRVSVPGEIRFGSDFYDFSTKYADGSTELMIPAQLDPAVVSEGQRLAVKVCEALRVEGMSRVDFFYNSDINQWTLNEVNTIPGFTSVSMYPALWEASGVPMAVLVDELVNAALKRHRRVQKRRLSSQQATPAIGLPATDVD